ncbi:MAG: GAF domain-containing protein [Deltaproteobacteria bacterium]|nr:GAF domain-containing protein [Deltaproteobacteria bacterium]MCL5277152.1 GAF domain-containing protein [Deltaproteobacteria bacterium]
MAAEVSGSKLMELEFLKRLFSIYEVLSRQRIDREVANRLYDELLGLVVQELSCRAGSLFIIDRDTGSPVFTAVKGGDEGLVGKKLEKGRGIVGNVAVTGTSYFSHDVSSDKTWMGEVSREGSFSTTDILACPIKYGEDVIGVVEVLNKKRGAFDKKDVKRLQGLTPHIAVFIKYFIDELERQRFIEMQTKLYELSMVLNSNLDTKAVVRDAMNAIVSLVDADVGSLMLVDRERRELFFEVALGDKEKILKQIRLKFGQGVAGWVAQQRQPVIVNDTASDTRFYRKADEKTGFVTKNILCVPVLSKNEVIGVIQALNKKEGLFTDHDLRLLTSLSAQIAIALENASLHEELKRTFIEVVESLAEAIEKRDPYTGGHTKRVVKYSLMVADEIGMYGDERDRLRMAALLHDVGKIGVDDSVLRKPARLDEAEFEKMKAHPSIGADILGKIPQISSIVPGILYHHEWYNGKGYPDGISGNKLPRIAKIISIADTYDAMTTDRPYRKGLTHEYAIAELRKFSGTQFDPELVELFIRAFEKTTSASDLQGL